MKAIRWYLFSVVFFIASQAQSQDVTQKLDEARSAYSSGNLENTRFALQQALQSINQAIAEEILAALPDDLGGMPKQADQDNYSGTGYGFAGLFVSRAYRNENSDATVEIISDSPLLAGINALLSMPVFLGSGDQKRIKIGGYKALQSRSEIPDGTVSYEVQMPFGNSLLSFRSNGIASEKEVEALLNKIPVEQIVKLAQ